jgi:hypothetical protein
MDSGHRWLPYKVKLWLYRLRDLKISEEFELLVQLDVPGPPKYPWIWIVFKEFYGYRKPFLKKVNFPNNSLKTKHFTESESLA